VTSDKEGENSVFKRELPDAEIVISQPFWPAYLTAQRIAKAQELKLAITAGIGSDHVDLQAAIQKGITVAEVTYSNSISVSEHVVMMILSLVRNYIPSYKWVIDGGWKHCRLRGPLLRSRSDGGRHCCRRAHRLGSSAKAEAVRRQTALH
jgi:formate dehydrogenase